MKTTYVVIKYWGLFEDKDSEVVYAGDSHEVAKDKAEKGKYNSEGLINGELTDIIIQHWENGENTKFERIYG